MHLPPSLFRTVVDSAPLVSIDLCCLSSGRLLLGERANDPLKGFWFTPGGRIRKGEEWASCLRRVACGELGLNSDDTNGFQFMEIADHFYDNSIFGDNISTHYLNLSFWADFQFKPKLTSDNQHTRFRWVDLNSAATSDEFHPNIRRYASYLVKSV